MSDKRLPAHRMTLQTKMRFGFTAFLILLFAYAFWSALDFQRLARYLPLTVSALALIVLLISLLIDIVAYRQTGVVAADDVPVTASMAGAELKEIALDEQARSADVDLEALGLDELEDERLGEIEDPREPLKRSLRTFVWILAYVFAIAIVGVMPATTLYLLAYLFIEAKTGWKIPVIGTAAILVLMNVMRELLNLEWPRYLLRDTVRSMFGG